MQIYKLKVRWLTDITNNPWECTIRENRFPKFAVLWLGMRIWFQLCLLASPLVGYVSRVLLILLNETESISYLKRVMGLWVWGERREGVALFFLASVKIPRRPQHSISPFCNDGEVVWEKLKAKVKWVHKYESIKTDGLSLTRNLQQT